jgi:hypothetical protein
MHQMKPSANMSSLAYKITQIVCMKTTVFFCSWRCYERRYFNTKHIAYTCYQLMTESNLQDVFVSTSVYTLEASIVP